MRRRLLIAAIFLLAGAVVNVAVAWGIALAVEPVVNDSWNTGMTRSSGDYWSVSQIRRPGSLHAGSARFREVPAPDHVDTPGPADLAPSWSGFDVPSLEFASGLADSDCRMVDARGWPALTLWYESDTPDGWEATGIAGGIKLSGYWEHEYRIPKALPLRPIWSGFAVNTVFYAAILWLLIPGPFALRRFIRVKRGLCPKCAYPMGESAVCSECGKSF